jgi:putative GTP pyrophosphokinase
VLPTRIGVKFAVVTQPLPLSNGKIDRAGACIRDHLYAVPRIESDAATLQDAIECVWLFRAKFNRPLSLVNLGVRYYIKQARCDVVVAQRLKRLPRIVEKMSRHPRMRLTQMQDVGGCRAILPDQESVSNVLTGLERNWDIIAIDDYVANPKATGYRAIHVIVRKEGTAVELQLRTPGQQTWAEEIERIDSVSDYALKDGDGPPDVLAYTTKLAEVISVLDAGNRVNEEDLTVLRELRRNVP